MEETPNNDIDLKIDKKTFKSFDETIQNKGELFVQEMGKAEKADKKGEIKEKADAFTRNSKIVLDLILGDINNGDKFSTIDANNIKEPKLQTYVDAKQAFEKDMKSLNIVNLEVTKLLGDIQNCIDLKQISTINEKSHLEELKKIAEDSKMNIQTQDPLDATKKIGTMDKTIKEIADKIATITKKEIENNKEKAKEALDKHYETQEQAKGFFETKSNEEVFNQAFDEIATITKTDLEAYKETTENKTQENKVKNFVDIINLYTKNTTDNQTRNICLKIATEDDTIYPKGTKIITFNNIIKGKEAKGNEPATQDQIIPKEIIFGSQEQMQSKKAEKFDISKVDMSIATPLAQFDGKGNYKSLEKYIKANPQKFEDNFKNIMDSILAYTNKTTDTTDKYEDLNDLKNGYANIITDYIVANQKFMDRYQSYLTKPNMDILGGDKVCRITNYNKLVPIWKKNRETMGAEEKQKILDLGNAIGIQEKMTIQETLSKGLDALIKQFGPMLFSILKMFGLGKGSLTKMFGKERVNKMFLEEYDLKDSKEAVLEISKDGYTDIELTNLSNRPTAKELKEAFKETEEKNDYIKILTNSEKNYYKHINVGVVQKGLNLYNQNHKTEININDVILTTTDSITKKQSITGFKGDITDDKNIFRGVLQSILDNDATWTNIASVNEEINIKTEGKVKGRGDNEFLNKTDVRYEINSQQDIIRYLTASLFSDKDLGYVMTENELHNGKETPKDQDKNKEQAKIAFENNIKELGTKLDSINDKGMYGKLDTNTFTGEEKTDAGLDYKNNIISPLKNSFIGKTEVGGKEYPNYDFLLDHTKGLKDNKINENMMIVIKNMLKIENNAEYKPAIDAIQKGNTYEISIVDNEINYKRKNSSGQETGTIILGVVNNTITTKRKPTETKAAVAESKAEATPQKAAATTPAEEKKGAADVVTTK